MRVDGVLSRLPGMALFTGRKKGGPIKYLYLTNRGA
jgi:hypothetical protein